MPDLTRVQRDLLSALAAATPDDESHVRDGYHGITWLRGAGFKSPTADVLERLGLVELGYDGRFGLVTARLTADGREAAR